MTRERVPFTEEDREIQSELCCRPVLSVCLVCVCLVANIWFPTGASLETSIPGDTSRVAWHSAVRVSRGQQITSD